MPAPTARRGTAALAGAGTLLLLALATAPLADASTIYGCVKTKGGTVRIVSKAARCKKGEAKKSWNTTGAAGKAGARGVAGLNGATGPAGAAGENGAPGAGNTKGANGLDGVTGQAGAAGTNGTNGSNGVTGGVGPTGTTGQAGASGASGSNGVTGGAGSTGATGGAGPTGPTGAGGAVGGYSVAEPAQEGVPFTSGTENSPTNIVSRMLPAGDYLVDAKVELQVSDTKAEGGASLGCKLVDTPTEGGTSASDTGGWTTLINVPFTSVFFAKNTVPLALAISSAAHPSTISIACYVVFKEAKGGIFAAEASNATITAVQTSQNS